MPQQTANRRPTPSRRDLWIVLIPVAVIVVGAFALTSHFIQPAPPKKLVLGTGSDEGGARYFARRYQEFLKESGVTLDLRQSTGADENVQLLSAAHSGVDVAFIEGGTAPADAGAGLVSLGSLTYTPVWIFYRGDPVDDLREFAGKRIGIGPAQSSTHKLALQLLAINHIEKAPTTLVSLDRNAGMKALEAGQIDALFLVFPAEAPFIQKFAASPGIRLFSFHRADAYVKRFPFLTKLVLPRGVFDLAADVPDSDVTLLSTTVNLIARRSLHPALAYLLMRAATEIHNRAGLLAHKGEFPAPLEAGFPMSQEATRYYQSGPPLLQRFLPFWAANLVDRLWLMLLPIIAVLLPIIRLVPPIYIWRVRARVYRWYGKLKELELELDDLAARPDFDRMLKRLDDIETAVNGISVPLAYSEQHYNFRQNLDLVRRRVVQRMQAERPERAA